MRSRNSDFDCRLPSSLTRTTLSARIALTAFVSRSLKAWFQAFSIATMREVIAAVSSCANAAVEHVRIKTSHKCEGFIFTRSLSVLFQYRLPYIFHYWARVGKLSKVTLARRKI